MRDWSPALASVVRLAVDSPYPVALWLGPHATLIANEAALPALGPLFPDGFAKPYPATAPTRYALYRQSVARVWAGQWVMQEASGAPLAPAEQGADAWWNVLFTPIREADGHVIGIHVAWQERTAAVLAARRLQLLNRLAAAATADNRRAALAGALEILADCPDIPFAAAWLLDAGGGQALLAGTAGLAEGDPLAPRRLATHGPWEAWPLEGVLAQGKAAAVENLPERFPGRFGAAPGGAQGSIPAAVPSGAPAAGPSGAPAAGPSAVPGAVICPLHDQAEGRAIGVIVLGTNPRLVYDELYQNFLTLVGETIAAKAAAAQARQRENERLDRLAELDRTKTDFFANISHEFRTPLTLMLAPLEDLLRRRAELPPGLVDEVEVAANNSRRLLRLVNSLLDFSQIETRRQEPTFAPTDLGALTADIASAFRSAVEAAGLRFRVECSPTLPPVWVDREMWEKIVSNLLSNAFKFTFAGEIAVELHALTLHAELVVKDTGIGIPEGEMGDIFKRFHRVRGARARTVEGSGIGLAIVDDLVKRLGGQLRARSKEGEGTEFTIWIPYKSLRVKPRPPDDAKPAGRRADAGSLDGHAFAGQLAEEAGRWVVTGSGAGSGAGNGAGNGGAWGDGELPPEVLEDLLGLDYAPEPGNGETRLGTILVADDNADMRSYLQRLLRGRWQVELAPDGEAALAAALDPARGAPPDVILADVMMPGLDGFQLTQRVRAAPQLADTPVILLTARTGEEAAIQGLQAGAGDYVAKPFSPRELLARIQGVYERGRTQAALRKSEARHAYLVQLGDGLRPLADPVQVLEATARIAMDYYGADRCYYCEVEQGEVIIRRDAARGGLPSVAGVYPLAALPIYAAAAEAGAPIVVADVAASDVLDEDLKQLCMQLEIIAYINVPVIKAGRYVGNLCITQAAPREWTGLEVELAVETAERTWEAVERARAEAALRESQAQLAVELADLQQLQRLSSLTAQEDVEAFYTQILDTARVLMRADMASMQMRMPGRGELLLLAQQGFAPESARFWEWVRADDTTACGQVLRSGGPVIVPDVEAWELVAGTEDLAQFRRSGIRAVLSTPLTARDGRLVGVISTHWRTVHAPPERELRLLDVVARQAADLLEQRAAGEALRRSEEKYRTLFASIDEGFCVLEMIFDAAGTPVDFRYLEVNEAFEQRTGLGGVAGKLASEVAPGTEPYWLSDYGAVALTGEPLRLENYHEPTGRWYLGYATRVGGEGSRQVAVVFDDITEHKREARRREYLLRLSDVLRPLGDPLEIQRAAMRLAGEELQVDCAMYNEIREGGATIHIEDNYVRGGFAKITGDFPVRVFGEAMDVLRRGEILVIEDQRTTPLKTAVEQEASTGLGVLASATVPLVKGGRWVANFGVLHGSPRRFTPDEIAILQETAERTWAEVARARAEAALRANEARLEAEVAERTAQVRELVTRLTLSEQEERRRISTLLHDDVQQRLFSFIFLLAAVRQALDEGEQQGAREIIGSVEAGLQEAVHVVRRLSVDLSPPVLHDEGLAEALRWLASQMKQQQGLVVEVTAEAGVPRLGEDLRVLLFQTVRELLFNVVKHAGVNRAAVTIGPSGGQLRIEVRDGGQGFAPGGHGAAGGGQGLRRIEQRMKLLGGGMELAAAPGQGTCVTLLVPVVGANL